VNWAESLEGGFEVLRDGTSSGDGINLTFFAFSIFHGMILSIELFDMSTIVMLVAS
jgi:hypothetical protein